MARKNTTEASWHKQYYYTLGVCVCQWRIICYYMCINFAVTNYWIYNIVLLNICMKVYDEINHCVAMFCFSGKPATIFNEVCLLRISCPWQSFRSTVSKDLASVELVLGSIYYLSEYRSLLWLVWRLQSLCINFTNG